MADHESAVTYALHHSSHRRTGAKPGAATPVPLLRALAFARPCNEALLSFFQSLIDLTPTTSPPAEKSPPRAENIEALISAGAEEGLIEEDDRKLIQSVMEFGDKVVAAKS